MRLFSSQRDPQVPIGLVISIEGLTLAQVALDGQGQPHALHQQSLTDTSVAVLAPGAPVVLALPDDLFHFDTLRLPSSVLPQDLEFQLGLLLAERSPWPMSDCAWDWLALTQDGDESIWACCVLPQSEVSRWQDWARQTGCTLLALEPARQALDREARWPWQGLPQDDTPAARLAWGLSLRSADDTPGFNLLPHRALRAAQARQRGWRQLAVCMTGLFLALGAGEAVVQRHEAAQQALQAAHAQALDEQTRQSTAGLRQQQQWGVLQTQSQARGLQQRQRELAWASVLRSVPEAEAGLQWASVQWQPDRLTWTGLAASEWLFSQWRLGLGETSVVQRWEPVRSSQPGMPGTQPIWHYEVRMAPGVK